MDSKYGETDKNGQKPPRAPPQPTVVNTENQVQDLNQPCCCQTMSVNSIPSLINKNTSHDNGGHLDGFFSNNAAELKSLSFWRAALAEFIGVFLLCLTTIGMGLKKEGDPGLPLFHIAVGVGFILAVLIASLTTVSGGHINPAISTGFFLTGQITLVRFIVYAIAHVTGGIVGAAVVKALVPDDHVGNLGLILPPSHITDGQAVACEIVVGFILLFVTIALVDTGRSDVQGSVPFLVGITVTANILYAGPISGGCMNPARNFGPAVVIGKLDKMWIYWVGPVVGSALGSVLYDKVFSTRPLKLPISCCHDDEEKQFTQVSTGENEKDRLQNTSP